MVAATANVDVERYAQRLRRRAERSLTRIGTSLGEVGLWWLWLVGSAAIFLLTTAVASVVDLRMLDLRRRRIGSITHDLRVGVNLFFRVFRDRRTPWLARLPIFVSLCYWLVPQDFIADTPVFPGFIDDVLLAVAGAKIFSYLCPDSVVARHAQSMAVKAEA